MTDTQDRLQLGLITRDELLAQQQVLSDAEARWAVYSGWADGLTLHSPAEGVVDRLPVSEGERVPAGDLLVSIVIQDRFEVQLGLEPEDAALVRPDQVVVLQRLAGGLDASLLAGKVRSVSLAVDPGTRLALAFAVPQVEHGRLLLGEFIRASLPVRSDTGMVVPRSALLPQEGGTVMFVVIGGRAYRRSVTVGVETDSLVQVKAPGVSPGDTVVVLGNYELTDSMRVRLPGDTSSAGVNPRGQG